MSRVVSRIQILESEEDGDYIGAQVEPLYVEPYLRQMRQHLGDDDFEHCLRLKRDRDGIEYHVTIVSPFEYGNLETGRVARLVSRSISMKMEGLGSAALGDDEAYFVIVSSFDLGASRQELGLDPIDFHITLGFRGADVHGVPKGVGTAVFVGAHAVGRES